jgi:hypothetical protein
VVLNPVQVGMTETTGVWPWSSFRAVMGKASAPKWQAVDAIKAKTHKIRCPVQRFSAE